MLDPRYVLEHADEVAENCRRRNSPADVAQFVKLEQERRAIKVQIEELNKEVNGLSKIMATVKDPAEREKRKEEGRQIREKITASTAKMNELAAQTDAIIRTIPNLSHPAAPVGVDVQANLEIKYGKHQPKKFDFQPLDHVQLGENLGLIDFASGAKVAGAGFYYLKGDCVLLDLALQHYAVSLLAKAGYTPVITPDLARTEILTGTGFIPRGPETQIYSINDTDLNLIATAEITLGGMQAGDIIDEEKLPIKLCGISHCYRTEAGAGGRHSRGLYRVHQFTKVEMFAYTTPEQSEGVHQELLELECQIFDGLGIPYRVVDTATGDLGGPAYRKYDLEAWMPGRGNGGEYGEVTSTSNCTDYQARRLDIRYRKRGEKGTQFVHTLNGTAVAISRGLIAVLENYQNADGSITVPEALRAWVGKDRIG